jgi:quercetin dioxygenase-like cupin family protein
VSRDRLEAQPARDDALCILDLVFVYTGIFVVGLLLHRSVAVLYAKYDSGLDPAVKEPRMEIKRIGSQPSGKGDAEHFTGAVRIDPLFQAPEPARVVGAAVTFEPGARTAWHSHPLGQTLIVVVGAGRVQRWGDPIVEIHSGDVVWSPPGEKHWHGAAPTTAVTHFAIQEQLDGRSADWMEKVSDEQYNGGSSS